MFRQKPNRLIVPGGAQVPAPDEKEIRIKYSAIRQYCEITERENKPIGLGEGLSIALVLANSFVAKLGELEQMTLCAKCGKPLASATDEEGGEDDRT